MIDDVCREIRRNLPEVDYGHNHIFLQWFDISDIEYDAVVPIISKIHIKSSPVYQDTYQIVNMIDGHSPTEMNVFRRL